MPAISALAKEVNLDASLPLRDVVEERTQCPIQILALPRVQARDGAVWQEYQQSHAGDPLVRLSPNSTEA